MTPSIPISFLVLGAGGTGTSEGSVAAQEAKAAGEEGRPKTSGCRSSSLRAVFFFRVFFFVWGEVTAFSLPPEILSRATKEGGGRTRQKKGRFSHVKTETTLAWQLKPKTEKCFVYLILRLFDFFL